LVTLPFQFFIFEKKKESSKMRESLELENYTVSSGVSTVNTDTHLAHETANIDDDTEQARDTGVPSANVVDFEDNDPEHPLNWPRWKKIVNLTIVSLMTLVLYAPPLPRLNPFHDQFSPSSRG
jgi:hypothetical protein